MSKTFNIEVYRQQKKRKRFMQRSFLIVTVILLAFFAFFVIKKVVDNNSFGSDKAPIFPYNLQGESPQELLVSKDSLVVTTGSAVRFMSDNAKVTNKNKHGFSKPVTKVSGKYTLTYDQGGYGISLDTKSGNVKKLKVKNQILFCEVSSDGRVAVASGDSKYTSGVAVYDSSLTKPLCTYYMNEYVMALTFTGSNQIVVAAQTVSTGVMETVLYGVVFNKDKEEFKTTIEGSVVYSLGLKSGNRMTLVCDDRILFLDKKGKELGSYEFQSSLLFVENASNGYTVIAQRNTVNPNQTDLLVFDSKGKKTAESTMDGVIRDLTVNGNTIAAVDENHIYQYSNQLKQEKKVEHSGEYHSAVVLSGKIFALSADQLNRIEA